MNNRAAAIKLFQRVSVMLITLAGVGLMSALILSPPVRADSPIFGRPGGDDAACLGGVNVDYHPSVAPLCAVKSLPRALSLAGATHAVVFDNGRQIITIPPNVPSVDQSAAVSPAAANLVVDKSDNPDPVPAGDPLTYTIRISNTGNLPANNVRLIDVLPQPGIVSFKSFTYSQGVCGQLAQDIISCTLGIINDGANAVVTLVVTPTAAGLINNQANVTVSDAGVIVPSDNETTMVEGTTNLSVAKADTPDPVIQGQPLTYTLSVMNSGPTAAADVTLTDFLPAGTTFGSATPSQGSCGSGPTVVTCALGLMNNGAAATVTLVVTPTTFGLITNTASITGGDIDPNIFDNVATQTTTVLPAADIGVSKSDFPDPVAAGGILTYTLVVSNAGPAPATNITLVDSLPGLVTTNTVTTSQGSCGFIGGLFGCNLGDLAPSGLATVTIEVTVASTATGSLANTVAVTTTASDLNPANNSDTETTTIQTGGLSGPVFLPIILKGYEGPWAGMVWVGQTADRVREVDGSNPDAFTPDGEPDGAFRATVSVGSEGPKTVTRVELASNQGVTATWDTVVNTIPVLGIFNGSSRLNAADGTVSEPVNDQVTVTVYASDDAASSRFPADSYDYTLTVYFDDGSQVTAQARIPAPPPPLPPTACQPLASITVGNTPRGVDVDEARGRVYAANYGSSTVSVIDTGSNSVISTVTAITAANGLIYDSLNDLIWVSNYSQDQVTPIEAGPLNTLPPVDVGEGPWGVTYDPIHDYLYVANNLADSVTVVDAGSRTVVATLGSGFNRPYHLAANPVTGKVYVANFGNHTVAVIDGTAVVKSIDLNTGPEPVLQPYGVAVDETRNIVYVATVSSHQVVALDGATDTLRGWAAFHRGFGDPTRPVPMRAVAVNPTIGPAGDGGHLWTTTSAADGSEADQALLIPKGIDAYFHYPVPCDVGLNPAEGIAIDRSLDRAFVTSGSSPGTVSVFEDYATPPLVPFGQSGGIDFEIYLAE